MPFLVGIVGSLAAAVFLRRTGFDRDRAVYPTLLVVIALLYVLWAVVGESMHALGLESIGVVVFTAMAVAGFKRSLWWAVAGLAGHGLYDFVHGWIFANPGVPSYWPAFCGAYDVGAAAWLAMLIVRDRRGR